MSGTASPSSRAPGRDECCGDDDEPADEEHGAEDVDEERRLPVGRADEREHQAPGLKIMRTRISSDRSARQDLQLQPRSAQRRALGPRRSRRAGRAVRALAGPGADRPENERGDDPAVPELVRVVVDREPDAEDDHAERRDADRGSRRTVRATSLRPASATSVLAASTRSAPRTSSSRPRARTRRARGRRAGSRTRPPRSLEAAPDAPPQPPPAPLDSPRGRAGAPPAAADRDDRRRQLDTRPRGGARAGRPQGRRGARCGRVLRLPLRRARRTSSCCAQRTARASRR